jgi:hypothetical protein
MFSLFGPSQQQVCQVVNAGKKACAEFLAQKMSEKLECQSNNGTTVMAGKLISGLNWEGDIQVDVDWCFFDGWSEKGLIEFRVRCPDNGLYNTDSNAFSKVFNALGFKRYIDRLDPSQAIPQDDFYAHWQGGCFTPGYIMKNIGPAKIVVLQSVLFRLLGITEGDFESTKMVAMQSEANSIGVRLEAVLKKDR